ncbi:MAG: sigma-70 family RNA polymerase sigma factor [Thermoanaerobaculia bacterium]|nr:sigma-70 family RNA polymerase sigma factor [Thermoanaerobaculia bacterium]
MLERLQPRLRGVFSAFRIPFEDAEDLLQQSLLAYLHKRDAVEDPERWVVGTIRNRCLMYWRSHRRRIYRSVDTAILESVAEPRRPAQETHDLLHDLDGAIEALPPRCRELLRLRYRVGYEPHEAARELGYKSSGIYKILERCLAALTRQLVRSGLIEEPGASDGT